MSTLEKPYGRRDRPGFTAARTPKGHPQREARRQRAAERLAAHVYDAERCGPKCPKRVIE